MKRLLSLALLALTGCAHKPQREPIPDAFFRAAVTVDTLSRSPEVFIWRTDGGEWFCRLDEGTAVHAGTFDACVSSASGVRYRRQSE